LDACRCGKPVVNIGFDWNAGSRSTQRASLFQGYTHLRRLIEANAVSVANNRTELLELIIKALADPAKGMEARLSVAERECGQTDGRALPRIVSAIKHQYQIALN